MSLWKKISLGVLIFWFCYWGRSRSLVGTTSGLHLVLKAADRWVPGLEIGKVTGGWRDLTLQNVLCPAGRRGYGRSVPSGGQATVPVG